jgi:hypothetical protein
MGGDVDTAGFEPGEQRILYLLPVLEHNRNDTL